MNKANVKIHNHFDLFIEKNGMSKHVGHAENVVTDYFYKEFDSFLYGSISRSNNWIFYKYLCFGSGTAEPTTDVSRLESPLGYKAFIKDSVKYDEDDTYIILQGHIALNPEEFVGSIISEVGLQWDASTTSSCVVSHALIRDSQNNVITVTKKADETLKIYATVYIYPITMAGQNLPLFTELRKIYQQRVIENNGSRIADLYSSTTTFPTLALPEEALCGKKKCYNIQAQDEGNTFYLGNYLPAGGLSLLGNVARYDLYSASKPDSDPVILADLDGGCNCNITTTEESQGTSFNQTLSVDYCNGLDIYGFSSFYNSQQIAVGAFGLQDVTGAELGSGDGVKTSFDLPHVDCQNVSVLLNNTPATFTLKEENLDEQIPLINIQNLSMACERGAKYAAMFTEYQDGYIVPFSSYERDNNLILMCSYVHEVESALKHDYVELTIPWIVEQEISYVGINAICDVVSFPDDSAIILNYYSDIPRHQIFAYDKVTGTVGVSLRSESIGWMLPSQDGSCLFRHAIRDVENNKWFDGIECYSVTRTANALTLTLDSTTTPYSSPSKPVVISRQGSAYVNNYITLCTTPTTDSIETTTTIKKFRYNYGTKSFTQIDDSTLGYVQNENYAVQYSDETINQSTDAGVSKPIVIGTKNGNEIEWSDPIDLPTLPDNCYYKQILTVGDKDDVVGIMIEVKQVGSSGYVTFVSCLNFKLDSNDTYQVVNHKNEVMHALEYYHAGSVSTCVNFCWDTVTIADKTLRLSEASSYFRKAFIGSKMYISSNNYLNYSATGLNTINVVRKNKQRVVFNTPPAAGVAVTANYQLEYVPKDTNWIIQTDHKVTWGREGE